MLERGLVVPPATVYVAGPRFAAIRDAHAVRCILLPAARGCFRGAQPSRDTSQLLECCFELVHHLGGDAVGCGQRIRVGQALVIDPKEIEAEFVAPEDVVVGAAAPRNFPCNHLVHHREQLTVYLRSLEVPVPSTYGPTADENPFG